MPSYSGTFCTIATGGSRSQPCPCRLDFDNESLTLIPGSGSPLSVDLGDIDELAPLDYELHLRLYTGDLIHLTRFGKSFQDLSHDLREAYRQRLVKCLLLDDLEEITRFDASAELQSPESSFSAPAELRLYRSNLAVLPQGQTGLQWRLAEIDAVSFDDTRYAVVLRSGDELLLFTRLAKRTREFMDRLQAAMAEVASKSAITVRSVFPFLTPEQFRNAAERLKEGRVVPSSQLASIHPKTVPALIDKVVSARLKPYYDFLMAHATAGGPYAGFKLIRREAEPVAGEHDENAAGTELEAATLEDAPEDAGDFGPVEKVEGDTEVLYWFIFPLRTSSGSGMPQVAAWETTSLSGRATYFFRLNAPEEARALGDPSQPSAAMDRAIRRLNQGLLLLNFRREPIYLSDDALAIQSRYRRYAIACRKIPSLQRLRSSFLGRALHTSSQAWQQQVERILSARY